MSLLYSSKPFASSLYTYYDYFMILWFLFVRTWKSYSLFHLLKVSHVFLTQKKDVNGCKWCKRWQHIKNCKWADSLVLTGITRDLSALSAIPFLDNVNVYIIYIRTCQLFHNFGCKLKYTHYKTSWDFLNKTPVTFPPVPLLYTSIILYCLINIFINTSITVVVPIFVLIPSIYHSRSLAG